jgi:rod shape determining protein RodA
MIYSATYRLGGAPGVDPRVLQQALYFAAGLGLAALTIYINYDIYRDLGVIIYVIGVVSLVAVLVIGQVTHGSQRWFDLGFTTIQPSEAAKLTTIIGLAKYLADREEKMRQFRFVMASLVLAAIPAVLTLLQPDMTTATVFLAIWLGMALMAGMRSLYAIALALFTAAIGPLAWMIMHEYQRDRVRVFLGLIDDPTGTSYNATQALIGVGSGGMYGRGFTAGSQSQLHFLRVQYADYIFSVLAEELGFIGSVALFGLLVFICWQCIGVAGRCQQSFPRLVVTGIATMIFYQSFVNIGMNIGVLPPAGITLPFVSYGGSSLLTALISIGLVENVALRARVEPR